jgi:Tol biopolymer transport system component
LLRPERPNINHYKSLQYVRSMTVERWRQIESIYHSALDRSPDERAGFIAEACKDDPNLRNEVEDLVRRDESPGWSLRNSPVSDSAGEPGTQLAKGDRLGPYEIVDAIGSGGMGVVYRAIDTRLGRSVAVKTSRGPFSDRFAREARTVAALNHPNICTLYDTGPDYLVMELIEGPTLADRISKGPLAFDEALRIARQIADAIETAHENGIVHRDLKPANIKFRADGSVKVLDFGLAKSFTRPEPSEDSHEIRLSGMILGTAAYMSPEQALGQEVDKRSDIWAFGVVLYEMLTGSQPFDGMADIVQKEPDLTKVPERVRRLLRLCLEKDPTKRLRGLGDWAYFIDSDAIRTRSAPHPLGGFAWLALPAILIAVVIVVLWAFWSRISTPAHAVRFEIPIPDNVQFDEYLALSPDGRKLVFNATGGQTGLWLRDLDKLEWRRLPGTEGGRSPFWSPDSRFIGFAVGKELRKVNVAGGFPQTLAVIETLASAGAWNKDGVIVFGGRGVGGLHKVADTGGPVTDLTHAEGHGRFDNFPSFLPDQKHFLYLASGDPGYQGVYIGSIDAGPATEPPVRPEARLLANAFSASYVDGNILFVRNGALIMQRFDAGRLALSGDPVRIADQVATVRHYSVFSAIPGALAYRTGVSSGNNQFHWFDRDGKMIGTVPPPNLNPRLSRDGTRAIVSDSENNVGGDYWILDVATGASTRLTFPAGPGQGHTILASSALCSACPGLWSPDGSSVLFPGGKEQDSILEKAADGSGPEHVWLTEPGASHGVDDISPDRRFLIYLKRGNGSKAGLWALALDASRRRTRLSDATSATFHGRLSPDGRWLTYATDESGRSELYVRPFIGGGPNAPALGTGRWQISRGGTSTAVRWRADGKELYYMDANDVIQAVEVDGRGPAFQIGASRPLFTAPCACGFDVMPDGKRFLMGSPSGAGGKAPITVVLNWQSELKTR